MLTSSPITITDTWENIKPKKPLKAITGDAALYLDITSIVDQFDYDELKKQFPKNTIIAKLITKNGEEFILKNKDGFSTSKDQICIIISGQDATPTNVKFGKIQIMSKVTLNNVMLIWRNSSI